VREEEDEFAALLEVLGLPSSLDDLLPSGGGALSLLIAEWLDDFFSFHAAQQKRDHADEADSTVRFPLPAEPLLAPALPYELDRCASFRFRFLRFRFRFLRFRFRFLRFRFLRFRFLRFRF
jgi:hypothetical protein